MQQIIWHSANEKPSSDGDYLCKIAYIEPWNKSKASYFYDVRSCCIDWVQRYDGLEEVVVAWAEIPPCNIEWEGHNG